MKKSKDETQYTKILSLGQNQHCFVSTAKEIRDAVNGSPSLLYMRMGLESLTAEEVKTITGWTHTMDDDGLVFHSVNDGGMPATTLST